MRRLGRVALMLSALAAFSALAAWLSLRALMAPPADESLAIFQMFAALGGVTVVLAMIASEVTAGSIGRRMLAATVIGPIVVAAAALVGARIMFIETHDAQFVVILVMFATVMALGTVSVLSRPLTRDLLQLERTVVRMGGGDLAARCELERSDEVGDLGRAVDAMAAQVESASAERDRIAAERTFMLASLSHDARTPLTAMRAAVEALQDGMAPDPVRYLNSVEKDLTAVEAIIENIFVLGRLDADELDLDFEEFDLVELVDAAVEAMEPLATASSINLKIDHPGLVPVNASHTETMRVLCNLLSNAIRHSPADGDVWVMVSNDEETPQVHVLDDGPGFDAEFLPMAFEQFTRADPARDRAHGGAGLGLAVAQGLVQKLGGAIWAFPGPGGKVGFSLRPA